MWPLESCDSTSTQRGLSRGLWLLGRLPGGQGLSLPSTRRAPSQALYPCLLGTATHTGGCSSPGRPGPPASAQLMASLGRFLMLWSPQALLWAWTRGELGEIEKKRAKDCWIKTSGIPSQRSSVIENPQTASWKLALGRFICSATLPSEMPGHRWSPPATRISPGRRVARCQAGRRGEGNRSQ